MSRKRPRRQHESTWTRGRQFVREYTDGLNTRELRRLFDRDVANAYSVLTRDHADIPEPERRAKRLLFRARLAFLGLSYKLTPPRRLLFAFGLVAVLMGFLTGNVAVHTQHRTISVDFSPIWFVASSASFILLLALELVDRVLVRDELQVARELQAELLPHKLPEVPGYGFAHSYRTANEVGGDYYDLSPLPDGRVALLIGDASGHGMAAGLVMAIANATLKTALDLDPSPQRVCALLNKTLFRTGSRRTFMSVFYALLDPPSGKLQTVCAGHPYPVLVRATGGFLEIGEGSLPLGMKDPLAVTMQEFTMEPGDLLVLYTDGLPEAMGSSGEAFSYGRLASLASGGGSPQQVHDRILSAFLAHVEGEPLRDDVTLLVVARLAAGA
jgi:sigma-B regulation protein RsbU (phosphoserine phosphatase)